MSIFDLLFIACFLGTLIGVLRISWLAVRRRWTDFRTTSWRLGAAAGAYMLVVILVGILSPRRVLPPDGILRYDDWCLGVRRFEPAGTVGPDFRPASGRQFLIVTLNVISKARRVRQAAPAGALVYVCDREGRRYDVSERAQAVYERLHGAQPALTTKLEPNTSFQTTRVFEVPRDGGELALGHQHGSGAQFPTLFIIGEGFRPPPLIPLRY